MICGYRLPILLGPLPSFQFSLAEVLRLVRGQHSNRDCPVEPLRLWQGARKATSIAGGITRRIPPAIYLPKLRAEATNPLRKVGAFVYLSEPFFCGERRFDKAMLLSLPSPAWSTLPRVFSRQRILPVPLLLQTLGGELFSPPLGAFFFSQSVWAGNLRLGRNRAHVPRPPSPMRALNFITYIHASPGSSAGIPRSLFYHRDTLAKALL